MCLIHMPKYQQCKKKKKQQTGTKEENVFFYSCYKPWMLLKIKTPNENIPLPAPRDIFK